MTRFRTQSRRASLVESLANIAVGIFIQGAGQAGLFYFMNLRISVHQFTLFTLVMTVLSVVRSYCLRRLWNAEWWKNRRPKCKGCKRRIDPDYCHCGDAIEDHGVYSHNHSAVPMGCDCARVLFRDNYIVDTSAKVDASIMKFLRRSMHR